MPFVRVNKQPIPHVCRLPQIYLADLGFGTLWRCDDVACGKLWVVVMWPVEHGIKRIWRPAGPILRYKFRKAGYGEQVKEVSIDDYTVHSVQEADTNPAR